MVIIIPTNREIKAMFMQHLSEYLDHVIDGQESGVAAAYEGEAVADVKALIEGNMDAIVKRVKSGTFTEIPEWAVLLASNGFRCYQGSVKAMTEREWRCVEEFRM